MSSSDVPATAPRVAAYGLLGRDAKLLLIAHANGVHSLPGGHIQDGMPVEESLRMTLLDQLGVAAVGLEFCAVVEHEVSGPDSVFASELAILFDVTLTGLDQFVDAHPTMHWWADKEDLAGLHPAAVRDRLLAGTLSIENPWSAWPG